jgi:hypothetical protein
MTVWRLIGLHRFSRPLMEGLVVLGETNREVPAVAISNAGAAVEPVDYP